MTMKMDTFKLLMISLSITYTCYTIDTPTKDREVIYQLDQTNSINSQFHIELKGTEYVGKKCRIMKETANGNNFEEIAGCEGNESGLFDKCARSCSGSDNKFTYKKLSPRSKYIYIKDVAAVGDAKDASHIKGGNVFGFAIALLVDPYFHASTHMSDQLQLRAITCNPVTCPIYYKGVLYKNVPKAADCISAHNDNNDEYATSVEYGFKVPYFEVRCTDYPIYYYHMPNYYMRENIDIYKPQFYARYGSEDKKTQYKLTFSNPFPSEICLFSIRDGVDSTAPNPVGFSSICGDNSKPCFSPCNDVELTLNPTKPIIEILVQRRHHALTANAQGRHEGYIYRKFGNITNLLRIDLNVIIAIIEPSEIENKLISSITSTGVKINMPLFTPNPPARVIFNQCEVKYYVASTPKEGVNIEAQCSNGQKCHSSCNPAVIIEGIPPGKAIMFEIRQSGLVGYQNFKEYLFIETEKKVGTSFSSTKPTIGETTIVIKAIDGEPGNTMNEPVCDYFISIAEKNQFEEAACLDSQPCRGLCKESKTVIDLEPNTYYDIKVVAFSDYGSTTVSNLKTAFSRLTLTKQSLNRGYKIVGTLSTSYDDAQCYYKINVKKGNKWEKVYSCVETDEKLSSSAILNTIARANTENNPKKPNETTPNIFESCTKIPLCSNIIFSEGYDASKEYQIFVTAISRSEEVSIVIPPKKQVELSTDAKKKIKVVFAREGANLKITSTLPEGAPKESKCKWELVNSSDLAKPTVKKCMNQKDGDCTSFPICEKFTIEDAPDQNDYLLTVYDSVDATIVGALEIKQGENGSSQISIKTTVIIIGCILGVVMLVGIGTIVAFPNRN